MSAVDEILAGLPVDQLAGQLGASPEEVRTAAAAALPALLGGLHANAQDPEGEAALAGALADHHPSLAQGDIDLSRVDPADGAKIAQHVFGGNQDEVAARLGGASGVSSDLVKKLIPLLAPIVLSWLAGKAGGKGGALGGGVLGTILSEVLKGAGQGSTGGKSAGSIISDVLGGLFGKKG